jgi:hypothetical protein
MIFAFSRAQLAGLEIQKVVHQYPKIQINRVKGEAHNKRLIHTHWLQAGYDSCIFRNFAVFK